MTTSAAPTRREQAVWSLFGDWCAALNYPALPADPLVLAHFLAANTATEATQRRRVVAVNAVHRRAGHPGPGHAETVRRLLSTRRHDAGEQRTAAIAAVIDDFPTEGWPTALFARRDAMLLVLAATGMPNSLIATLRVGQIEVDAETDTLTASAGQGQVFSTSDGLVAGGVSPLGVWERWVRLRAIQHHLPSTRWLAAELRGDPLPRIAAAPEQLPLLTPVDRWGDTPLLPTPLSAASVGRIIGAHLRGSAKPHQQIAVATKLDEPEQDQDVAEEHTAAPRLDPGAFSRGVAARQRAAAELRDVTATLDDIDSRADALLADLLELLDGEHSRDS